MNFKKIPRLYEWGIRFPWVVLSLACLVTVFSWFAVKNIRIESDVFSLLPRTTESVQNLNLFKEKFGGFGFLVVVLEGDESENVRQFADEFSERLEHLPSVRYVDHHLPVEYFKKHQWLYLDSDDLHEIERRIDRALELQKQGVSAIFGKWMDFADKEDRPDLTFRDILQKYKDRMGLGWGEVSDKSGKKIQLLRVKPLQSPQRLDFNRQLLSDIRKIEMDLRREGKFSSVQVGYTGDYPSALEEADQIEKEIKKVSFFVFAVLFLILLLYFRKLLSVLIIALPLAAGVLWSYGVIHLLLGHLNIITSFAGAILAGLGSDYGIYLLSRYEQERERGADFLTASNRAFFNTGKATYASMITTVGAFAALLFSDFGVFAEFGVVGALGVLVNYLAMMLIIPAFLALREKYGQETWILKSHFSDILWKKLNPVFLPVRPFLGVSLTIFLIFVSSFTLIPQSKIYFEDGQMDTRSLPSNRLYSRVTQWVKGSLSPTVLMVASDDEKRVVRAFADRIQRDDEHLLSYNRVLGLSTFLPENQQEKKIILKRVKEKLHEIHWLVPRQKQAVLNSLSYSIDSEEIREESLPEEVKRNFRSMADQDLRALYLYPAVARISSEVIRAYQMDLESVKKEEGLKAIFVDASFVQSDLVDLLKKESPRVLGLTFLFLTGVLLILVRPLHRVWMIGLQLVSALVLLSAILWCFRIPLNIMNIAVFPIILGTGIDCFIHFSLRHNETLNLNGTIHDKIPSILVSNLTSMVGFSGLLLTSSQGLRSMGWVAVFGLAMVNFLCVWVFPRVLLCFEKNRRVNA